MIISLVIYIVEFLNLCNQANRSSSASLKLNYNLFTIVCTKTAAGHLTRHSAQ